MGASTGFHREDAIAFLKRARKHSIPTVDLYSSGTIENAIVQSYTLSNESDEEIADAALSAATGDTAGRHGHVRFELVGHDQGKQWGRLGFVIDAGPNTFENEDATVRGVLTEVIRDRQFALQKVEERTESIFGHFQETLQVMSLQIRESESLKLKLFELISDLSNHKAARDRDDAKLAMEIDQNRHMVESLKPLLPALATRLMGPGNEAAQFEAKQNLEAEAMKGFLTSFDQRQVEAILPTLNPMQATIFMQALEQATKEQEAKDSAFRNSIQIRSGSNGVG